MTEYRTIRPGALVSLSTSIDGGVEYQRHDLDANAERETNPDAEITRWETTKIVVDPAEHAAAVKVRGKCRALITSVCTSTARHLLCPTDRVPLLRERIAEARKLAWDFNQASVTTSVTVSVIVSKIATSDQEAAQEIGNEFRQLVALAESAVAQMDKKAVQDAAARMKDLGQMFNPDSALKVDDAVAAFRKVARKIGKAGDAVAVEIDEATMAKLRGARTAYLELDSADDQVNDDQDGDIASEMRVKDTRAIDFDAWNDDDDHTDVDPADTPAGAAPDGLGQPDDDQVPWDDDDNQDTAPKTQFADIELDDDDLALLIGSDNNTEGK